VGAGNSQRNKGREGKGRDWSGETSFVCGFPLDKLNILRLLAMFMAFIFCNAMVHLSCKISEYDTVSKAFFENRQKNGTLHKCNVQEKRAPRLLMDRFGLHVQLKLFLFFCFKKN